LGGGFSMLVATMLIRGTVKTGNKVEDERNTRRRGAFTDG
jgi:hypothetical protein